MKTKTRHAVVSGQRALGFVPPFSGWSAKLSLPAIGAIATAGCLLLGACSSSSTIYSAPTAAFSATPKKTLSVGDVIKVTFPGAPEYNQSAKIQSDGRIGLPMVGNVAASDRTASSLQASLSEMYKPHLNDSRVFVTLEQPSASVYISGEVAAPGKVALDRPITALEGVMEVGGFSKFANPKKVYVIRTEAGKQKRFVLNLANPLSGQESQAFYLRPYDVVYVEKSVW